MNARTNTNHGHIENSRCTELSDNQLDQVSGGFIGVLAAVGVGVVVGSYIYKTMSAAELAAQENTAVHNRMK